MKKNIVVVSSVIIRFVDMTVLVVLLGIWQGCAVLVLTPCKCRNVSDTVMHGSRNMTESNVNRS